MTDDAWLTEHIGEAIRECLEQGFELPVYASIIASNGACAFFAYDLLPAVSLVAFF